MRASDRPGRALRGLLTTLGALAALFVFAGPASAQQAGREQEMLRRLRQQVQQLQQDSQTQQQAATQAQAEKADLQHKLDAAQAEIEHLRAASKAQERKLGDADNALQAADHSRSDLQAQADQQKAELDKRTGELQASRHESAQRQQRIEALLAAQADLESRHRIQATGLEACIASNGRLAALGHELLQRYADKTVREVLEQNEPFVQTRRVALENLVQGYEDKLDRDAIKAPAAAASAGR